MDQWARVVAAVIDRRAELGWTQKRLAEEAGVGERTVQNLEGGKRPWPVNRVKIERALGWEPGEFRRIEEKDGYEPPILRPSTVRELVDDIGEEDAAAVAEFLERRRRERASGS